MKEMIRAVNEIASPELNHSSSGWLSFTPGGPHHSLPRRLQCPGPYGLEPQSQLWNSNAFISRRGSLCWIWSIVQASPFLQPRGLGSGALMERRMRFSFHFPSLHVLSCFQPLFSLSLPCWFWSMDTRKKGSGKETHEQRTPSEVDCKFSIRQTPSAKLIPFYVVFSTLKLASRPLSLCLWTWVDAALYQLVPLSSSIGPRIPASFALHLPPASFPTSRRADSTK